MSIFYKNYNFRKFKLILCTFLEDYQERLISPKMRPTCFETVGLGASSTGSSRRSSPLSNSMFSSNCSSAQSTSPPNSPSTMLISSPNMIMQSTSSFQQSPQVSAQNFQTQSLMCVPTTSSPNASSPSSYSGSVASMSTRQSRYGQILIFPILLNIFTGQIFVIKMQADKRLFYS